MPGKPSTRAVAVLGGQASCVNRNLPLREGRGGGSWRHAQLPGADAEAALV